MPLECGGNYAELKWEKQLAATHAPNGVDGDACSKPSHFEESGSILSFQYLALEKVLVFWLSFVLHLGIKWEMWIIFFPLQHGRYPGDARTATSLLSDQHSISMWLVEIILNVELAEQSWLTGKLASVRQQIRASAKCLKLWEKSILSNETAARAATCYPFVPTQQESFFTSYDK